MRSMCLHALPPVLKREFKKLGKDIRYARIRRNMTVKELADKAFISENTMMRIEKGAPTVSIGIYGRVLYFLGLRNRMGMLADISCDAISQELENEKLPKRVRH